MKVYELTIALHAIIESTCPTNESQTYEHDALTILTSYLENQMEVTTNEGTTFTYQVNDAQLLLEQYKQPRLKVTISTQIMAIHQSEVLEISERIVSNLKNGIDRFNDFLLYNEDEDEVYTCKVTTIKEIQVPIETIFELEVAV